MLRPFVFILVVSLAAGSWGCGPSLGLDQPGKSITIVVLDDGKPVTSGFVELSGQGGGNSLNEQGEAKLNHVPFGEYQVAIFPKIVDEAPQENAPPSPKSNTNDPSATQFPKNIRNTESSPLRIDVQSSGDKVFQFDLKKLP